MPLRVLTIILLVVTATAPTAARAQQPTTPVAQQVVPAVGVIATLTAPAPVHTFPLGLQPVTTLDVGAVVSIVGENGDWWQVEYDYTQFGSHVGWVRKSVLRLGPPSGEAVRAVLRQPRPATASPPRQPGLTAAPPAPLRSAPATTRQPAAPANAPLSFRGYFSFDMTSLLASETYNGLLGSSAVFGLGGGAEIGGIGGGFFLRFGLSQSDDRGERAVLVDGTAVPVGIPITIRMMPIEMTAGWRHTPVKRPPAGARTPATHAPYSVYAGGGLVLMRYSEESDFAEPADNLKDTFPGFVAYGGLSVDLGRWMFVSGEGGFRSIPNAIGSAGLSQDFGETNLGGAVLRVMVGIRSKK